MFIYQIVKDVQETFRGLCERLEEKTRKTKQGWAAHGYEPKSINPLAHGVPSPADHYVEFAELYEDTKKGAGAMLNERVYFELRRRFNAAECEGDAFGCLIKHLNATTEISTELTEGLRDGKFDRSEIKQIRNKLPELSANIERIYAMLDYHENLLENPLDAKVISAARAGKASNGNGKRS